MTPIIIIIAFTQIIFLFMLIYQLKSNSKSKTTYKMCLSTDSKKEMIRLNKMRNIKLTKPYSETLRPLNISEIIGQDDAILALKAAICTDNPQHVLIYGPPGVGKTAASRLLLEEAKRNPRSPFNENSKFIEIDATTLRFDERSIADPLIGSVHDPIYQGAGEFGNFGIPRPHEGAVTKANGGILFIDEIGELHSTQMNKLLKVLEDRKVFFTSSYYNPGNTNIPEYIHDIFKNGLPADFRLIGATTRRPEEIPQALRSRCIEIYFNELLPEDIMKISENTLQKTCLTYQYDVIKKISEYAVNGRNAINIIQMASSLCNVNDKNRITVEDVEWIIQKSKIPPLFIKKSDDKLRIGRAYGLGVSNSDRGHILEIEAVSNRAKEIGKGTLEITGIVIDEEIKIGNCVKTRKSNAYSSIKNALSALKIYGIDYKDYDIHINITGGILVDGPSAGAAFFASLYSAITKKPIKSQTALSGEISISGYILPVGGIKQKVEGAKIAGIKTALIPFDNKNNDVMKKGIDVVYIKSTKDIIENIFIEKDKETNNFINEDIEILSAKEVV